jgi:hypothetical protein
VVQLTRVHGDDEEGTDLIYEGITTQVWWSAISDFKFQKH